MEVVNDQTAVRSFFSKDQKAGLLLDSCESCVFEVRLQLASPGLTCLFFVVAAAGSRTHRGSVSHRGGVSSLSFRYWDPSIDGRGLVLASVKQGILARMWLSASLGFHQGVRG